MQEDTIVWKGYEFEYKEKTTDWFWAVSIIIVSIASISIIYDNYLFALFIVLAGITSLTISKKEPSYRIYQLDKKGVTISKRLFPYKDLKSFYIEDGRFTPPKLLLKSTGVLSQIIVMPIETDMVNGESIKQFLLDYLPEEELHEPIPHKIMEFFGF